MSLPTQRRDTDGAELVPNRHVCVWIGYTISRIMGAMSTIAEKIAAEQRLRDLMAGEGLPAPDEIEYGHTCIRALWHEAKVAVVVDLDDVDDDAPWPEHHVAPNRFAEDA